MTPGVLFRSIGRSFIENNNNKILIFRKIYRKINNNLNLKIIMWHVTIPMYKPIEQHERGQQNAVEEG